MESEKDTYLFGQRIRASTPLGIPTVRDRVAQMAAKMVIEPILRRALRIAPTGSGQMRIPSKTPRKVRSLGHEAALTRSVTVTSKPSASSRLVSLA